MHESLRFSCPAKWNCTEGEEDAEDAIVFGGRVRYDPCCETGIAWLPSDSQMFFHRGLVHEGGQLVPGVSRGIGSFNCVFIHQFCEAIVLGLEQAWLKMYVFLGK